ncbi:MAG: hypothetical protein ABW321_24620 [Polyangiales bacterium]
MTPLVGHLRHRSAWRCVGSYVLACAMWIGCGSESGAGPEAGAPPTSPNAPVGAAGTLPAPPAGGTTAPSPTNSGSQPSASGASGSAPPAQTPPAAAPTAGSAATPPAAAAGGAATPPMSMNPTVPTTPSTGPVTLPQEPGEPTLFWLDIAAGLVTTAKADGSGSMRFASGSPLSAPDGVTVDPVDGHVFVLNMGSLLGGANNGSLVRYNLDGSGAEVIMPPGTRVGGETFNTGKQVTIDKVNRKLYMADREGSKVWRCDLDGKNLEVLVSDHDIQQVVGVGADPIMKHFYFSDRNGKKLFRAPMDMPAGKTAADRDDVELLYVDAARNAMPLDIELDLEARVMYWTDRQQNIVFSMGMDIPAGADPMTRSDVKQVATGLLDVIGLAFDHETDTLYATHSGSVSSFKTDGSELKRIGSNGSTGIAFARIP